MSNTAINRKIKQRRIIIHVSTLMSVIVLCCLALYVAGLSPQSKVRRGLQKSAHIIENEGFGPQVFNMSGGYSSVDNYTETIILSSSFYMDSRVKPDSILSNPFTIGKEDSLHEIAYEDVEPASYYTRYWQGFRAFVRPLLALFDYGTIRLLINLMFNILFSINLIMMRRFLGVGEVFSFAISLIMLNLATISSNVQHSMVFLIAFFSLVILMMWKNQISKYLLLYFCVIGMITQYFDFYTAPLVTFGYPMVLVLLLLRRKKMLISSKDDYYLKLVLACLMTWLIGYIGMWFMKMLLTSLFTPHDGFESAINAFVYRIGIKKNASSYSVPDAFKAIFISLLHRKSIIVGVSVIGILVFWGGVIRLSKDRKWKQWITRNIALLFISTIPLVWFALSAQPTIAHSYFQFRPIGITIFCVLCIVIDAYTQNSDKNSL